MVEDLFGGGRGLPLGDAPEVYDVRIVDRAVSQSIDPPANQGTTHAPTPRSTHESTDPCTR